ncbi:MAG: tRNA (adenosine(37)-N6)-threonylcarbamoyltransferase complex dimerization subunit type 1 TsaB [Bacteroidia bacterium]
MAYILCIESATGICSVALLNNEQLVATIELKETNAHAGQLTILIDEVLRISGVGMNDLGAIAVSKGPGSYTGLRVGVSTAKGLCYALDIPLIGVETLDSLANHFISTTNFKPFIQRSFNEVGQTSNYFIPMLDARRMEVYCKVFDENMKVVRDTKAEIIDEISFQEFLEKGTVYFFGEGSSKCKKMIPHANAIFVDGIKCHAKYMAEAAYRSFSKNDFEDVAYFEPFYLKDFVGTKPE